MPSYQFKVALDQTCQRLDVFLTQFLPQAPSRSFIQKLIEHGHVKVNEVLRKANYKIQQGEDILVEVPPNFLSMDYVEPEAIDLNIFYEDEWLLVINKPTGMMVHPAAGRNSGTLVNALLHHQNQLSDVNSQIRPGIVHRLDEETSGLILVAKDNMTHAKLAKQFQKHMIKKRYVALVEGRVEFEQGKIDVSLGRHPIQRDKKTVRFDDSAKEAVTYYEVLKRAAFVTLIALFPQTGRTHQLRVHMAHLKHPILGDEKYGKKNNFSRLALHAQSIGFIHPRTQSYIEFSSTIPTEFISKVGSRNQEDIQKLLNI